MTRGSRTALTDRTDRAKAGRMCPCGCGQRMRAYIVCAEFWATLPLQLHMGFARFPGESRETERRRRRAAMKEILRRAAAHRRTALTGQTSRTGRTDRKGGADHSTGEGR